MADFETIVNHVAHLLKQGGWFMLLLYLMGQAGWMITLQRWWSYRAIPVPREGWMNRAVGRSLSASTSADTAEDVSRRLIDAVGGRGPFADLARELAAVKNDGEAALVRKAREHVGALGYSVNRGLGTIAAFAAAAPMMGLAGTISGVMVTFGVITLYGAGNPAMMAGGIAEALMVTEAALVIAIPLVVLHDRLQARADRIESEAVAAATTLIRAYTGRSTISDGAASAARVQGGPA
jgi:biopolymer transport protein ExbB/TolQ